MPSVLSPPKMNLPPKTFLPFEPNIGLFEAALSGAVAGSSTHTVFGKSADLVTGSDRDLWPLSSTVNEKTWALTAGALSFVSDSADDTNDTGPGSHLMFVQYLDAGFKSVSVVVALNGLTPVTEDTKGNPLVDALRINRMRVVASANAGLAANVGTIVGSIAGAPERAMGPGTNQDYSGYFTVPVGKVGVVHALTIIADASHTVDIQVRLAPTASTPTSAFNSQFRPTASDMFIIGPLSAGPLLPLTDIRIRSRGTGATDVLAGPLIVLFNAQD